MVSIGEELYALGEALPELVLYYYLSLLPV